MTQDAAPAAINAAEFFAAHESEARDYVRVYAARSIKTGESRNVDAGGFFIQTRADTAGYELSAYLNQHDSQKQFLDADEFKARAEPADAFGAAVAREELTAEDLAQITPVAKGQTITVDVGLPIQTKADYDGFTVDIGKSLPIYLSGYALTTLFNYAGAKKQTHEDLVVRLKDEPALKGVILAEKTTFAFKEGDYEAEAGSFLFANAEDVDGYTVMPPGFAQFGLRLAPGPQQSVALETAIGVRKKPVSFKK